MIPNKDKLFPLVLSEHEGEKRLVEAVRNINFKTGRTLTNTPS